MLKTNWIEKLQIECIEEEDGCLTIQIDWDDTDPDLAEWTSWGEEGQKQFIIDSLYNVLECFIEHDD
jgi:hypothetical protein